MDQTRAHTQTQTDSLFAWRNTTIVLLGYRSVDGWVLARGWRRGDQLTDIRRWCFPNEHRFIGQVRRLVREAADHSDVVLCAADAARDWTARSRDLTAET